mgnify:CR=1 FL=1
MTKFIKKSEINSDWIEIDATNAVVGRLATIITKILRGKNKNTYSPHVDHGDFVIVKNAEKIKDDLKFVLKSVESGSALQNKFELRPTILWLLPNSFGLELIFVIGTISGLLLIFGVIPHVATAFSWICYLSITVVSAPFLNFQWDQLLIETTLLSILYLPWVSKDKVSSLRNPQCIGKLITVSYTHLTLPTKRIV